MHFCGHAILNVSENCFIYIRQLEVSITIKYQAPVSMGKLVNPFASHAKDPRFEPEWRHFIFWNDFESVVFKWFEL